MARSAACRCTHNLSCGYCLAGRWPLFQTMEEVESWWRVFYREQRAKYKPEPESH